MIGSILEAGASLGLGLAMEDHNDRRQYHQQKKLQALEISGQKEMSDYQQKLALDMWERTNYAAQVEQMQKAGLNVGLMYQGGGAGGTTQGAGRGDVSGATAQQNPGELGMAMQLGLQKTMQEAQIELVKAQTEKTKTETAKTGGVDTEEAKGRLALIAQQTKSEAVRTAIHEFEKDIAEAEASVDINTVDAKIHQVQESARKLEGEANSAVAKGETDKATQNAVIDEAKLKNIETMVRMAAIKAGVINTKQETNESKQRVQKISAEIRKMSRDYMNEVWNMENKTREIWIKEQHAKIQQLLMEHFTSTPEKAKQWMNILAPLLGGQGQSSPIGFQFGPGQ